MKKVLVTGASGFIGRHCLPFLNDKAFQVNAVCRNPSEDNTSNIKWHQADLLAPGQIKRLIDLIQPTHLLHFAWYAEPGKYWHSTENIRWVRASLNLMQEFAERGGERIVMAGSCAEYDWNQGVFSETITHLLPKSLYGVCKNSLQALLSAYSKQVGISSAWGRIFFVYGPFEHPVRLVPSVINSLLEGKPAQCSHGNQIRDYLYVSDAAEAFTALLESNVEGPINIGSGEPVKIKKIISHTAEKLGESRRVHFGALPSPEGEPPVLVADTQKLFTQLGWRPKIDLDEGLNRTINWWKSLAGK